VNVYSIIVYVVLVLGGFVAGYKVATWHDDSEKLAKVEEDLRAMTLDRDAAETARVLTDLLRARAEASLLNYQEAERLNNDKRKALVPRVVESNRACDLGTGAVSLLNDARRGTAMPSPSGQHARPSETSAADHWLIADPARSN
jgi:hypothetical protein